MHILKKGEMPMKKASWLLIGIFLAAILVAGSTTAAGQSKIIVVNPRGIQPPIRLIPMAPRPESLEGKTVYIVDTKYPLTAEFADELPKVMAERYPKTNWVLKKKIGSYFDDDPKLWEEAKEKAAGVIMIIGH
jgi:hypothetical protein